MNKLPDQGTQKGSVWTTVSLALSAAVLVICIIYDPGQAFDATLQGLTIWWHIVFPGLLPFYVLTEMLIAYGFIHGLGTLLGPLLRRFMRLPGEGAYLYPLGFIAGFPSAAQAAAKLHTQGRISAQEASRLAIASHFCSPMLLIVVIATGFMHAPSLGLLLACVHIAAGILAGITHALLRSKDAASADEEPVKSRAPRKQPGILASMETAHRLDGRSFGKLLGDTVADSVQALMRVGGYILIFALVIQIISRVMPSGVPSYVLSAIFEVHLGSFRISEAESSSPALQMALLGAGLGWGGLCGYFQVRGVLKPAGISTKGFLTTRLLHGGYAFLLTLLVWKPVSHWFPDLLPASPSSYPAVSPAVSLPHSIRQWMWVSIGWQTAALGCVLVLLTLFAMFWQHSQRIPD